MDCETTANPAGDGDTRADDGASPEAGAEANAIDDGMGDLIVENLDLPGGEKVVKRLQAILPEPVRQAEQGENPQAQAAQAQVQQLSQALDHLGTQLQAAQADKGRDDRKLDIDAYRAVTGRSRVGLANDDARHRALDRDRDAAGRRAVGGEGVTGDGGAGGGSGDAAGLGAGRPKSQARN